MDRDLSKTLGKGVYYYFNAVVYFVYLQALLEMADISSAATMVNYYTDHPPQIRGRTVYVQFSNHEQLKTEQSSPVPSFL